MNPGEVASWRSRMATLYAADCRNAERILLEQGFSAEQAAGAVKDVRAYGAVFELHKGAPPEFRDPNNPCFYAVRLLAIATMIDRADPMSLQVGRLWGRYILGIGLPEIAKAVRVGHLAKHRGRGGSTQGDLARTLNVLLSENPTYNRNQVLTYLQSDRAADRFHSLEHRTIFVAGIEIDDVLGVVRYEDQSRTPQSITFDSLDRKLRAIKKASKI